MWTSIQQADFALRAAKAQALTAGLQAFSEAERNNPAGGNCVDFLAHAEFEPKLEEKKPARVTNWGELNPRSAWVCMASAVIEHPVAELASVCPFTNDKLDESCKRRIDDLPDEEILALLKSAGKLPREWLRQARIQAYKQLNAAADLYAVLSVGEPSGIWPGEVCRQLFYTKNLMLLSEKTEKVLGREKARRLMPPDGCMAELEARG